MPGSGEAVKSKPTSTNSNVWVDEDPVSAKDVTDCFKEERDEYLYGLFDPIDLQNAFESRGASTCVVAEAIGRLFGSEKVPETTQGKLRKAIARAIESFGTDKPILEEVEGKEKFA